MMLPYSQESRYHSFYSYFVFRNSCSSRPYHSQITPNVESEKEKRRKGGTDTCFFSIGCRIAASAYTRVCALHAHASYSLVCINLVVVYVCF